MPESVGPDIGLCPLIPRNGRVANSPSAAQSLGWIQFFLTDFEETARVQYYRVRNSNAAATCAEG